MMAAEWDAAARAFNEVNARVVAAEEALANARAAETMMSAGGQTDAEGVDVSSAEAEVAAYKRMRAVAFDELNDVQARYRAQRMRIEGDGSTPATTNSAAEMRRKAAETELAAVESARIALRAELGYAVSPGAGAAVADAGRQAAEIVAIKTMYAGLKQIVDAGAAEIAREKAERQAALSPLKREVAALVAAGPAKVPPIPDYSFISTETAAGLRKNRGQKAVVDSVTGSLFTDVDGRAHPGVFHKDTDAAYARGLQSIFASRACSAARFRALSHNGQGAFIAPELIDGIVALAQRSLATPEYAMPGTQSLWRLDGLAGTRMCARGEGGYDMIKALIRGEFSLDSASKGPSPLVVLPFEGFDQAREGSMDFMRRLLRAWLAAFEAIFDNEGTYSWAQAFGLLIERCDVDVLFKFCPLEFLVDAVGTAMNRWFLLIGRPIPVLSSVGEYYGLSTESSRRLLGDIFREVSVEHTLVQAYRNRRDNGLEVFRLRIVGGQRGAPAGGAGGTQARGGGESGGGGSAVVGASGGAVVGSDSSGAGPTAVKWCMAATLEVLGFPAWDIWSHKCSTGSTVCKRKHPTVEDIKRLARSYFGPTVDSYYGGENKAEVMAKLRELGA